MNDIINEQFVQEIMNTSEWKVSFKSLHEEDTGAAPEGKPEGKEPRTVLGKRLHKKGDIRGMLKKLLVKAHGGFTRLASIKPKVHK